jgi:hypothetical protein
MGPDSIPCLQPANAPQTLWPSLQTFCKRPTAVVDNGEAGLRRHLVSTNREKAAEELRRGRKITIFGIASPLFAGGASLLIGTGTVNDLIVLHWRQWWLGTL